MTSFSTEEEVRAAMAGGGVFLDVRRGEEIQERSLPAKYPCVHVECTRTDASQLVRRAQEVFPDKDAPVIAFCRSGARSQCAKVSTM